MENSKAKVRFFNEKFTKDLCSDFRSIKAPVSAILELVDKFLLIIGIKDRSWQSFRNISKDFHTFKDLMNDAQNSEIPENLINEVLFAWKNQITTKAKLSRITPAASILFEWLTNLIECNIKKEIILTSQKRIPELEKKIKSQSNALLELSKEELVIEELQISYGIESERDEGESSITSKPYSFLNEDTDKKNFFQATVERKSLTGVLVGQIQKREFPDFAAENLYKEVPVDKEVNAGIVIETGSERIGCCRLKFFCF